MYLYNNSLIYYCPKGAAERIMPAASYLYRLYINMKIFIFQYFDTDFN